MNSCRIYFHGHFCSEFLLPLGLESHLCFVVKLIFFFLCSMATQPWNSPPFLWLPWQKHWEISVYSGVYWRFGLERSSLPQRKWAIYIWLYCDSKVFWLSYGLNFPLATCHLRDQPPAILSILSQLFLFSYEELFSSLFILITPCVYQIVMQHVFM